MARLGMVVALILMTFAVPASAEDSWVLIAQPEIDLSAGSARIDTTPAKGRFKEIKLVSRGGNILIHSVVLSYADGHRHEEVRKINLLENERTRAIDPHEQVGDFLDQIELTFEPSKEASDLKLEIWGLQSAEGAEAKRPQQWEVIFTQLKNWPNSGSGILGQPTQLLDKAIELDADRDVVLRDGLVIGIFDRLQISVEVNPLFAEALILSFDSGPERVLPIGKLLKPGDQPVYLRLDTLSSVKPAEGGLVVPAITKITLRHKRGETAGAKARVKVAGDIVSWLTDTSNSSKLTGAKYSQDDIEVGVWKAGKEVTWSQKVPDTVYGKPQRPTALGDLDCVSANTCTPVRILFGTNRQKGSPGPIIPVTFSGKRDDKLNLGEVIVTVPKAHRELGQVERPEVWSWTDLFRPWSWSWFSETKEDPAKHFMIAANGPQILTQQQFDAAVAAAGKDPGGFKDHAFIYIHGYNNTFEWAAYRTAQMAYDLGEPDGKGRRLPFGRAFMFSWPSLGNGPGYTADEATVEASESYLEDFLKIVTGQPGLKNVHIVAHSMGNRALLRVLSRLAIERRPDIRFQEIILAAPDVDKDVFIGIGKDIAAALEDAVAQKTEPLVRGVTLYASKNDKALWLSSEYVHGDYERAGYFKQGSHPVVAPGVETIDISEVGTQALTNPDHNTYAESRELVSDIAALFVDGRHPPRNRNRTFDRHDLEAIPPDPVQSYWAFPKQAN